MKYNGFRWILGFWAGFIVGATQILLGDYWWICTIIMFFVGLSSSTIETKLYGKD